MNHAIGKSIFCTNHIHSPTIYKNFTHLSLLNIANTWFASSFIMLVGEMRSQHSDHIHHFYVEVCRYHFYFVVRRYIPTWRDSGFWIPQSRCVCGSGGTCLWVWFRNTTKGAGCIYLDYVKEGPTSWLCCLHQQIGELKSFQYDTWHFIVIRYILVYFSNVLLDWVI